MSDNRDLEIVEAELLEGELVESGEWVESGGGETSVGAAPDQGPPDPTTLGLSLPAEPQAAIDLLLVALANARDEAGSYLDDLRRVAADFDNFRKRAMREQSQTVERAAERVVASMLPVLDSFEAALAIDPQTEAEEKLLNGMRSTRDQLVDTLAKEGLEAIATWGEPFDPEVHEAVMSPSEGDSRLVVGQELRRGYRLRGKLLRAALVGLEYEQ